jgi:hypothetical protein
MQFIEANAEVLSIDQIASKLDRDPDSVKDWISKNIGFSAKQKKEAAVANELKAKPYYRELKYQFSEEELEMFEFHFKKMWSQFKDDVFHTEEMQIIDTIKLEILMNRILKSQQDNQVEISTYDSGFKSLTGNTIKGLQRSPISQGNHAKRSEGHQRAAYQGY